MGGGIEKPHDDHLELTTNWNGMQVRIRAIDWMKHGVNRAGSLSFLNTETVRTSPCVRPLREFAISHDGSVFPCCQFYPDSDANKRFIIGSVASESIFEIYASHTLAKWRTDLLTFGEKGIPCNSCRDEDFSKIDSMDMRQTLINRLRTESNQ